MAKRKKPAGTRLPRLTVLSWSKRELAQFVEAVEKLHHLVETMDDVLCKFILAKSRRKPGVPTQRLNSEPEKETNHVERN